IPTTLRVLSVPARVSCGHAKLFLLLRFSPLILVPSGPFLQANSGIENVRWRRHHRGFFWSERGDTVGRGDADAFSPSSGARSLNSAAPATGSEIFRLDRPRRRGWVDPPPPR